MDNNKNTVLTVENLNVTAGQKKILKDINFTLEKNDILGLVGETGSGKSVLVDSIGCNLPSTLSAHSKSIRYKLDDGEINLPDYSRDDLQEKYWGKALAFILSNARSRFNPIIPVGQTFVDILMSNYPEMTKEEATAKAQEYFKLVQMPDPVKNMNNFPQELSGGMVQRVEIAIALSLSTKFLLMDEPTMGLDVTVQRQILDLIANLVKDLDSTIVIATRDLGIVANYCNKIAVMHDGEIVEFCGVRDFFKNPQHPYSKYMLKIAFASNDKELTSSDKIITRENLKNLDHCFCADACEFATEECRKCMPEYAEYKEGHFVKCHRFANKEAVK